MPASVIVGALEYAGVIASGSWIATAATFAIRVATTLYVAELLNKKNTPAQAGGEVSLGPYTDNTLPVIYGTAYVSPMVTDILLSNDQQTIWYVVTFGEVTQGGPGYPTTSPGTLPGPVVFDEIWYNGKLIIFDPNNPNEIQGLWNRPKKRSKIGGKLEVGTAGSIGVYLYANGSNQPAQYTAFNLTESGGYVTAASEATQQTNVDAISLLSDSAYNNFKSGLDPSIQWTSYDKMTNAIFAVIRLNYNPANGVTGFGSMTARIVNPLYDPGACIYDYLTNSLYGCAISPNQINLDSLTALTARSQNVIDITLTDGSNTQTQFQINGIIDTTQNCLDNLSTFCEAVDGWVQWDERIGQWGITLNQSLFEAGLTTSSMTVITSDQIIGGINLVPTDLANSPNKITISFPNPDIIGQTDYRYYWLEPNKKSPNEPENNIDISYRLVADSAMATYLGYRKLWLGRQDLIINFSMDYSGIHINAGDIVAINHEWYGWDENIYDGLLSPGKPFRVNQIKEVKDDKGFLSVQITAQSYNDSIYTVTNPLYYQPDIYYPTPDLYGQSSSTQFLSAPGTPVITTSTNTSTSGINAFIVSSTVPTTGVTNGLEFWYSMTTSTISGTTFTLYQTQYYSPTNAWPQGSQVEILAAGLPQGQYYWATRAEGQNIYSAFSDVSSSLTSGQGFSWSGANLNLVTSGGNIIAGTLPGSAIEQGNNSSPSSNNSFWNTLGEVAGIGLVGAAGYGLYTGGYLSGLLPSFLQSKPGGLGNDTGELPVAPPDGSPPLIPKNIAGDGSLQDLTDNPQQGQQIVMVADATPPLPPVTDNNNFQGYNDVNSDDSDYAEC